MSAPYRPLLIVIATCCGSQGCARSQPPHAPSPEPSSAHITEFEVTNPTTCTALVWRPDSPRGTLLGTVPATARRTFVVPEGTWVFAVVQSDSGSACDELANRRIQVRKVPRPASDSVSSN
jgi:hypothetical protein